MYSDKRSDMTNFIDDMIIQAQHANEFEVMVDVPDNFRFTGTVPYTMHVYGSVAYVTVPAKSLEEAKELAHKYFEENIE
jgi:hypothetical protein